MSKKIRFSHNDVRGHTDAITDRGRALRGGGFDGKQKLRFRKRVLALLGVFCFIVVVFVVNLVALQAAGNAFSIYTPTEQVVGVRSETLPLQAPRGEIYDRNGNKLVTNTTSYTLSLDYDAFYSIGGAEQRNRALLDLFALCTQEDPSNRISLAEECFPFEGVYPSLRFSDAARDDTSDTYRSLQNTLRLRGMEGSSASQIVQYYVTVYHLGAHTDGIPLYTNQEISTLIRLYYNMDRMSFSSATPYLFATGLGGAQLSTMLDQNIFGLRISAFTSRKHLYEGYAAHLLGELISVDASQSGLCNALGYSVNEIKGKSGCEGAFDAELQGKDGALIVVYDAHDNIVSHSVLREPVAGKDLYLTIDIGVQIAAEDALRVNISTVANTGGIDCGADCNAGAVIAADPASGEVIALASFPSYNNIIQIFLPEGADDSPYLNRTTAALYDAASLFQLCAATAALDTSLLRESTQYTCNGIFSPSGSTLPALCPLYEAFDVTHEQLSVKTALSDGCDVFFAQVGSALGVDLLTAYGNSMGLGQATGMELTEQPGSFSAGETPAHLFANGEGTLLCTPAQLCSMLSTLITGGDRYSLRLFDHTRSYISSVVLETGQSRLISRMRLGNADTALLLSSMETAATANTLLMSKTEPLRQTGIRVGYLGASSATGTVGSDDALLLSYGIQPMSDRALSVCVILENGADPTLASPTAAAVLDQYFR